MAAMLPPPVDNTARVWDSQSGAEIARLNHDSLTRLSFSPDGRTVATASVNAVSFSPDGRTVATASGDDTVRVWNSQSGAEIARLNHDSSVNAVSFSPDGRTVATASMTIRRECGIARAAQKSPGSITIHLSYAVSFSPDGRTVATASGDNTARVWDSQSGAEIARLNHDSCCQRGEL